MPLTFASGGQEKPKTKQQQKKKLSQEISELPHEKHATRSLRAMTQPIGLT